MNKLTIIIFLSFTFIIISFNCLSQKSVHKKKIVHKKEVVKYCPIDINDSLLIRSSSEDCCVTLYNEKGYLCTDSTGMSVFNRRRKIGDTTYFMERHDTSIVILLTKVDGTKLKTKALKVTDRGQYLTSTLYEDTVTKKHIMGNSAWGFSRSFKDEPFVYLDMDRNTFHANVYIYGEVQNN